MYAINKPQRDHWFRIAGKLCQVEYVGRMRGGPHLLGHLKVVQAEVK